MPPFRFIHASDLHLGRRFANIPQPPDGNIRGRLMEARHAAIGRLAQAARDHGAHHVLIAGDTFDTATPSPHVLRQALTAMGEDAGVQWWLLPGNHDNLRDAEELWATLARDAPANVHALATPEVRQMAEGVSLLPCPVTHRATGRDLTAEMPGTATPEGDIRLGLAHGGVVDFTEDGAAIPPDRDRSARLDYLALGDWHGRLTVSDRVHYPGSPEQDRFKHDRRGGCLAVTLGAGAPEVAEVETGSFLWREAELPLLAEQDADKALRDALPATGRRDILLRLRATGWARLPEQVALTRAAEDAAPDFAHFELRSGALGTLYETADLDEIDRGGALRLAANALRDESEDETRAETDRTIARAALARLYAYVKEDSA
ncbi:metallophosphoesterase family protein [Allosediminivita pacifica]|uniref:DNA repair exonuclease SbcCD nuclease subunit n=1 Tax=Allosediminivita pacifica TaxID=1267769 RepID=A0A2T6AW80_9RHOB|nr:DNA repair exonuclease [Allosediminivita pacifica]PTX48070.1 DNA repair exonuclease SbcCD nuclease subunit [Allosediminivita pacifica]GGB11979.1 exonuclease [Allosediminivita pacifica]